METKRISNPEIIKILKEVLAAMEVKEYNFFRIRAYQNALSIFEGLTVSIQDMWENNSLKEIPGIGDAISRHLDEFFREGTVKEYEMIKSGLPEGMFSLIGIRGIGAKKAFKLANAFKLVSRETAVEELKEHARNSEIQELEGFGVKSEKDILESIEQLKFTKNEKKRTPLYKAEQIVTRILDYMKEIDCVVNIDAAGSFRRRQDTVGDLDFPVATTDPQKTLEHFLKYPEIAEVLVSGDKKVSVVLSNDMQVDMRVSEPEQYGSMLQYFTGDKLHNISLRNYALEKKLSLSEYGIKEKDVQHKFKTEEAFYEFLGLPCIPPELRQGSDEISLAKEGKLPKLIELKDIRGDLHMHTVASDGLNTFEEMVETAEKMGYEYIGITDHAPSVQNRGHAEVKKIITDMRKKVDDYNSKSKKLRIFFGYEVNILVDATMALPDDLMSLLDYAIGGIHTSFNNDKEKVTERLVAALENPYVKIISHPSGRVINERDPIDPDWDKVFQVARDNNKILEINAQPTRLDLTDDLVRSAKKWDIKFTISTDSHAIDQLFLLPYGIDVARRSGCTKDHIINTSSLSDIIKILDIKN